MDRTGRLKTAAELKFKGLFFHSDPFKIEKH
jgi:hypothetical protein